MVSGKSRQPARFGAEVWSERFGRDWSLWDLWYCVVIELDPHAARVVDRANEPRRRVFEGSRGARARRARRRVGLRHGNQPAGRVLGIAILDALLGDERFDP